MTPFRVGLLVLLAGAILLGFLTFVRKGTSGADRIVVKAYFRDASGLNQRSRIQIAGIQVGEIISIELEGVRARLKIAIRTDAHVHTDAALVKRSESLLGDYLLDLSPGSEGAPLLKDGDEIAQVLDASGTDEVLRSLGAIASDIQSVTKSLRVVLGGAEGQKSMDLIVKNLVSITSSLNTTLTQMGEQVATVMDNVVQVTSDVRALSEREKSRVDSIISNVDQISVDTREVVASIRRIVGSNEGSASEQIASVKESLAKLDRTLGNIESVTKEIKDHKGIAGALLDEKTGQSFTEAIGGLSEYLTRLTNLNLEASIRADYLFNQASAKTALAVRIIPRPDKFYLLELVDDPRGLVSTSYIQQNPPSAGNPAVQREVVTTQGYKFSAQFAKKYGYFTLRLGIIESTGGLGGDFNLPIKYPYLSRSIPDALSVKLDVFNFSVNELRWPRLRATVRLVPFEHFFVNGGIDDSLNDPNREVLTNRLTSGRDFFVGAGVYFTDSDLLSVLPVVPRP